MEALKKHDWPGNVRQLENMVRRAMVLCNGPTINIEHLEFHGLPMPPASGRPQASDEDFETLVDRLLTGGHENLIEDLERLLIARALEKMNGNQLRTARLLGITRNTLRSRIDKFGLKPKVNVV